MNTDSVKEAPKYWLKTRLNNVVRHAKSGRYYARLFFNGKEKWQSLKTTNFSIAEVKAAELRKTHRETRDAKAAQGDTGNAKMKFAAAAAIHMQRLEERVTIKRRTKKYWRETLAALLKSWPDLESREIRRISPELCREWAIRYAKVASDNRYNNSVSLLRHIFDVAIEHAVIYTNPAAKLERVTVRSKKLELPTLAKFGEFIAEMRRAHSRDSKNCADLTEGLAYTGMRLGESWEVAISDVHFEMKKLRVAGDPEEGTKNGEVRWAPLIPQARALFERMIGERPDLDTATKLFLVRECQKSMDRAAKKVGMKRITHHDLRHFFATICIERGVEIPTIAKWLGHKDGGALAMKTYGHLRDEHSDAQAEKVSFLPQ